MTYYEKLVESAEQAMREHPRSTIAMDAETFEVVATGSSSAKVARAVARAADEGVTSVVFQRPRKNETWIL